MKQVPILYLWIYKKLVDRGNYLITHRKLKEILRRTIHQIPKPLHIKIIREMEEYGLIENVNKDKRSFTYRVLPNVAYREVIDVLT